MIGEIVELGPTASPLPGVPSWSVATTPSPMAAPEVAASGTRIPRPVSPHLRRDGLPGESLDAFRARLKPELDARVAERLAQLEAQQAPERGHWDKRLAELKELLAYDQRELVELRRTALDPAALRRAEDRARLRIDKYKQAKSMRQALVTAADRARVEAELWALEVLAGCTLL